MTTIQREEFKKDKIFNKLHKEIIKFHKVGEYTKKNLIENKNIKDFCEESRHFMTNGTIFISYDVSCWFKHPMGIQIKVDSITIYESFMEYESVRLRELYGDKVNDRDLPNQN